MNVSQVFFSTSGHALPDTELNPVCPTHKCSATDKYDSFGYEKYECDDKAIGKYIKTTHGTLFISNPLTRLSWKIASNDCCARGGHLLSLPYHMPPKLIPILKTNSRDHHNWVGAIKPSAAQEAVWCLPGEKDLPIKGALEQILRNNASGNCVRIGPSRKNTFQDFQLVSCKDYNVYTCMIEVLFPDSCFNPSYNYSIDRREKLFHWRKDLTRPTLPETRNFSIIVSAKNVLREQGQPYYFTCGAKTYMGIMKKFLRIEAVDRCQDSGMHLLSINSLSEMKCLLKIFDGTMSSSYWTSGVNFGTANLTTYGWCSTGEIINETLWAEDEPRIPERNRCVALTVMEDEPKLSGLEAVTCEFELPLICKDP